MLLTVALLARSYPCFSRLCSIMILLNFSPIYEPLSGGQQLFESHPAASENAPEHTKKKRVIFTLATSATFLQARTWKGLCQSLVSEFWEIPFPNGHRDRGKYLLLKRDFMDGHVSCLLLHTHTPTGRRSGSTSLERLVVVLHCSLRSGCIPVSSQEPRKEQTLPLRGKQQQQPGRKRGH